MAAPEGNQKKGRSLLQFLADRFYDVQALREYLLRKQAWKMHQKNRPFTYIKERYGPYAAGAYFILKLGGAVKYEGKSVWGGLGRRSPKPEANRTSTGGSSGLPPAGPCPSASAVVSDLQGLLQRFKGILQ